MKMGGFRLEEKKAHPARETSDAAVTLQIPEGVVKTAEDPPEVKESVPGLEWFEFWGQISTDFQ